MLSDWSGSAMYMKKYVGLGPPTHLPLKSSMGRAVSFYVKFTRFSHLAHPPPCLFPPPQVQVNSLEIIIIVVVSITL